MEWFNGTSNGATSGYGLHDSNKPDICGAYAGMQVPDFDASGMAMTITARASGSITVPYIFASDVSEGGPRCPAPPQCSYPFPPADVLLC